MRSQIVIRNRSIFRKIGASLATIPANLNHFVSIEIYEDDSEYCVSSYMKGEHFATSFRDDVVIPWLVEEYGDQYFGKIAALPTGLFTTEEAAMFIKMKFSAILV